MTLTLKPSPATFRTQADGYESLYADLEVAIMLHENATFEFTALSDGAGLPVDLLKEVRDQVLFDYREYAKNTTALFKDHIYSDLVLQGADPRDVMARYEAFERSIDASPVREAAE